MKTFICLFRMANKEAVKIRVSLPCRVVRIAQDLEESGCRIEVILKMETRQAAVHCLYKDRLLAVEFFTDTEVVTALSTALLAAHEAFGFDD